MERGEKHDIRVFVRKVDTSPVVDLTESQNYKQENEAAISKYKLSQGYESKVKVSEILESLLQRRTGRHNSMMPVTWEVRTDLKSKPMCIPQEDQQALSIAQKIGKKTLMMQ